MYNCTKDKTEEGTYVNNVLSFRIYAEIAARRLIPFSIFTSFTEKERALSYPHVY